MEVVFALLPFMLLWRPRGQQKVGKDELRARFDKFGSGQWAELLADRHSVVEEANRSPVPDSIERRAAAAMQKVKLGEVSRARQCLTGAALAPGTEDTLNQMQDRRPQVATRELPQEVREFEPAVAIDHRARSVHQVFEVRP